MYWFLQSVRIFVYKKHNLTQSVTLLVYTCQIKNVHEKSHNVKCLDFSLSNVTSLIFLTTVFNWSILQEWLSAIWFGWYCPYCRECITLLDMYICNSVWLIGILCQHNVSDWEDFTPAAMMVLFSWGRRGIVCGVWVFQRWDNI